MRVTLSIALCFALAACQPSDAPAPAPAADQQPSPAKAPATGTPAPLPPPSEGARPAAPAPPPETKRNAAPAPHSEKAYKITVTASWTGMPAGARIVAPSARDRRWQKVTRSEHQKVMGSVMLAEADENLVFVSDALTAEGATGQYQATFEVVRRAASQGRLVAAKGLDWGKGQGQVGEPAPAAAVAAAVAELKLADAKPYARLTAVLGRVSSVAVDPAGATSPEAVLGGGKASALGLAATTAELCRAAGLPARVIQGLRLDGKGSASAHAWLEAELPRLGWVPLDPVAARGAEEDAFLGSFPPDRVDWVYGSSVAIPDDGTMPRLAIDGPLASPFGLLDGKRVGDVTWKAAVEELPAAGK